MTKVKTYFTFFILLFATASCETKDPIHPCGCESHPTGVIDEVRGKIWSGDSETYIELLSLKDSISILPCSELSSGLKQTDLYVTLSGEIKNRCLDEIHYPFNITDIRQVFDCSSATGAQTMKCNMLGVWEGRPSNCPGCVKGDYFVDVNDTIYQTYGNDETVFKTYYQILSDDSIKVSRSSGISTHKYIFHNSDSLELLQYSRLITGSGWQDLTLTRKK